MPLPLLALGAGMAAKKGIGALLTRAMGGMAKGRLQAGKPMGFTGGGLLGGISKMAGGVLGAVTGVRPRRRRRMTNMDAMYMGFKMGRGGRFPTYALRRRRRRRFPFGS